MRSPLKRLPALLLCLCLACAALAALAEEPDWDPEMAELAFRYMTDPALITLDEDGQVLQVNGHDRRSVHGIYYDKGQREEFGFDVEFLDYPFWEPSTVYDGNLAVMSLGMALSASRPVSASYEDPAANLQSFLTEAGFTDIRKDDYSKVPTMYTVSTAMGQRTMEAEGEEPFTLIAIGVCGSNYQNEWQSNMTPGDGDVHEGFLAASQLVLDRLAGYIAARGIKGRIKVWISGFSRAAAVANLTAAALTDTGWLAKEDVYAYTFATPAAVHDPPTEGYEHIWNIICPTDPVPQVMPADWGYGRYGKDCYLPVPEFSSFLGGLLTKSRAETDRSVYGVENNYSPELNLRIRLLISLLLDVTESREHFNETFQPALVGIMQDKTLPNTLTTLRELMIELKGTTRERRVNEDELMDYLIRVFSGSMTRSGLGANNRNSATAMYRLFNEHNENSYLANMDWIQSGYFEANLTTHYVMVRGPVTVTIAAEGDSGEPEPFARICSNGETWNLFDEDEELRSQFQGMFCMERCGDVTVVAVPEDVDYRVIWTAEKSGTVTCLQVEDSVRVSARYEGAMSEPIRVQEGDTGEAYVREDGANVLPEGFTEKTFDARELAQFMGIASLGINWRLALTAAVAVIGLAICVLLCVLASRKPSRRKQYGFLTWMVLCVFGMAALETELAFWFFAEQPLTRTLWKAVIAVCLLFILFRVHPPKENLLKSPLPGLLLAFAGDMVISSQIAAGMALFLLCHLALILWFQRTAPISRGKWIQWLVVALLFGGLIVALSVRSLGALGWAAAGYAAVLLLMNFCAGGQSVRVRYSARLFLLSDTLLGLYALLMKTPLVHAAYMFLFYAALLLLAIGDSAQQKAEAEPPLSAVGVSA